MGMKTGDTHTVRPTLDLIGQTYEKLTVIDRALPRVSRSGATAKRWLVQCSCGSEPFEVDQSNLRSGATKSCGCVLHAASRSMLGSVFGKLTVNSPAAPYVSPSGRSYARWTVQCDCGSAPFVETQNRLRKGERTRCSACTKADVSARLRQHKNQKAPLTQQAIHEG